MHPSLVHFEYDLDGQRILDENMADFTNTCEKQIKGFQTHGILGGYGCEVSAQFKEWIGFELYTTRLLRLQKGHRLGFHKDIGTIKCAFNFIISKGTEPISFRDCNIHYRNALVNVQEDHAIFDVTEDRMIYKIGIYDLEFEEVKDRLLKLQNLSHRSWRSDGATNAV